MKNIYSSPHLFLVDHYKTIVESRGIPCIVKNRFLSGAAGELPPTEVWPILCVENNSDYTRARQIVDEELFRLETDNPPQWVCAHCGEHIEGQFTDCWKCGSAREL